MCPLVVFFCKLIIHVRHNVALCYYIMFQNVIKLGKFQCLKKTKYFFHGHLMSMVGDLLLAEKQVLLPIQFTF